MRVRIVARGSLRLEPVTQIPAGDKSNATAHLVHRLPDARSESQVIVIREKAVTQRYHFPAPAVAQEKVKRNGSTVIEIMLRQRRDVVMLGSGGLFDRGEQFFVDRCGEISAGRVEVCEVAGDLWPFVSNKRINLERSVRRDQNDRLRAALDEALREL